VGASLAESDDVPLAKEIMAKAHEKATQSKFVFYTPRDVVVATDMKNDSPTRIVDLSHNTWADIESYPKKPEASRFEVGDEEMILDVGPFSASHIAGLLRSSATVIWNGTAGVTEVKGLAGAADPFAHGTKVIVEAMLGEPGEVAKPFVVVGGGDTVGYVESVEGLRDQLGHVSTGGGASLELMSGKELPGVAVLWERE
jgi:phosphoglycerate kinase